MSLGPMRLTFVELSCLQVKIASFHVEINHMTSKNRSRSSIFKLNRDTPKKHPCYKFGPNVTNICRVIVFTSEKCKFSCWNRPPWPWKIGPGQPPCNLAKTPEIHPWYKFGPNATNICQVIVFTSMTLKNRSRSTTFKLSQDTPEIHPWYKFGPNATNICRVIVFTSKNYHVEIDPHDLEK